MFQDKDNTTLHLIDVKTPLKIKVKDLIELYATHEEFVNNYGVDSDFMYSYVWFPDDKHHMMFVDDFYAYSYEYHLEEYVYLFEYTTTDESLSDLLNEVFDELIDDKKQSISFAEYLISIFPPIVYESNKKRLHIPTTNYLVLEMIHLKSYDHYSGGYEYDLEYNVIGYLDKNLSTVNKLFE